jgi:hypothetical protein
MHAKTGTISRYLICVTQNFALDCPGKHAEGTLAYEDVLFAYENKLDRRSIDIENFFAMILDGIV